MNTRSVDKPRRNYYTEVDMTPRDYSRQSRATGSPGLLPKVNPGRFILITSLIFILVLLGACVPKPEQIAPYVEQTLASWPTQTAYPTYTPNPTFTPANTATAIIKIVTPTSTPTPEFTATPKPTLPPFNVANCVNFTLPSLPEADKDVFDGILRDLVGKCVKFYFDGDEYILGTDLVYMARIVIVADSETPPDVKRPDAFGEIWGMLDAPLKDGDAWRIRLRKASEYPKNQQPITGEGLYAVGTDKEISPGIWKSGVNPTWTSSCYWARINPTTGNIKANHFGVGGITVRVYEGEIFETNDDCLDWYYLGP